uniref:Peroxin-19 n=1 Tax=Hirondellea gigas TaxID=1518452 RepID=A0A2P2IF45_9CRUS
MSEDKQQNSSADSELDSLLDDALEDFSKPPPSINLNDAAQPGPGAEGAPSKVLTEAMIRQATQNFEASMRAIMVQQQDVAASAAALRNNQQNADGTTDSNTLADTAQFDMSALTAELSKFAETASKVTAGVCATTGAAAASPTSESGQMPDFQKLMAETMQQMAQNNQKFQNAPSESELSELLSGVGLGSSGGDGTAAAAGLFPLMQSMLENILTRDVLYHPIKEIVDKYPDWLANNRMTLEATEFDRYSRQFDAMKKVVELFDSEAESDSDEVKARRFDDLLVVMQKLQAEGQPPPELAGDAAGNADPLAGAMPTEFADMLSNLAASTAQAAAPPADGSTPNIGEEQCSIM